MVAGNGPIRRVLTRRCARVDGQWRRPRLPAPARRRRSGDGRSALPGRRGEARPDRRLRRGALAGADRTRTSSPTPRCASRSRRRERRCSICSTWPSSPLTARRPLVVERLLRRRPPACRRRRLGRRPPAAGHPAPADPAPAPAGAGSPPGVAPAAGSAPPRPARRRAARSRRRHGRRRARPGCSG